MSLLIKYNNKFTTIEKHLQLQFIFIFCSFFSFFFCLFGILFSYFGKNHYLNRIFKQAQSKINLTDVLLTDNWKSLSGHSVLLTRLAKTTLNNSQICHVPIIKHRLFQLFNCFIYHFIIFFTFADTKFSKKHSRLDDDAAVFPWLVSPALVRITRNINILRTLSVNNFKNTSCWGPFKLFLFSPN